jgi:hypothetical protein
MAAVIAMSTVATVHAAHHQKMQQRTQQHERKGQQAQDVCGVVDEQVDSRGGQDGRQRRTLRCAENGGQTAWWSLLIIHVLLLVQRSQAGAKRLYFISLAQASHTPLRRR